jgi:transcriptional regulator with XRE-family HTH domain
MVPTKFSGSNDYSRPAKGPTHEELAFEAEIDLTYVGGIERGKRNPSLMVKARIADSLRSDNSSVQFLRIAKTHRRKVPPIELVSDADAEVNGFQIAWRRAAMHMVDDQSGGAAEGNKPLFNPWPGPIWMEPVFSITLLISTKPASADFYAGDSEQTSAGGGVCDQKFHVNLNAFDISYFREIP